ncbi:alpha/beta fold hydrolase [Rhizobium laguerreae]|uniref:alpha/beta fold hydrolase n=1 Tax=Rhizobium laguerreae TaxID=1076926 RepID=UPI001C8FDFC2|nr:alpha/beta fold hydrolase [Rhizobium laguerreae]MBY3416104.1 alpha/beta fold hydrolase [Rhizobium laguerreae]
MARVGNISISHIGFLTPGNYPDEDPLSGLEQTLEQLQYGEDLGFDSAWVRQRHLEPGISSASAFLAAATKAYLVAHSLGCLLAARLAGRSAARRVKGALLVAPCDLPVTENLHPGHISFGPMPTAPLPFPSIVVGSMNDAYMTVDRLTLFGRLWNAETRNIGLAGHINVASGFGRWRNGYRLLEGLKTQTRGRRHVVSMPPAFAM